MTQKFSFQNLDDRIDRHRDILLDAMQEEYKLADEFNIDPSSKYVQEHIYSRFREKVTDEELLLFNHEFQKLTAQRDRTLQDYVENIIHKLQSWENNEDLIPVHFIHSITRDIKTNSENKRTTFVTSYYGERTIEKILREKPEEYISKYLRPDGTIATISEIEILSTSNMTGLYNPFKTQRSQELDSSKYIILSRVKNSEREMKKLVDWLENLRDKDDYPYDAIAVRVIFRNKLKNRKNTDTADISRFLALDEKSILDMGKELYRLRDQIVYELEQYGKVIQKNVNIREQNDKASVKKLLKEEFDSNNFLEVINQMRDTYNYLKQLPSKNISLTEDQKSALLPYIQLKGAIHNERVEIQLMTEEMDFHYSGEFVGHTSLYLTQRDEERDRYLRNPAESSARKNAHKNEFKLIEEKKDFHEKTYFSSTNNLCRCISNNNSIILKEPNIKFLTKLLEDMYRPVFNVYTHHSFGATNGINNV